MKADAGTLQVTFLGTRGGIDVRSRRHRRHSSLLVQHNGARIMIDCGADWLGRLHHVAPTAILLTHAHPDHAAGLASGAPCPVYATQETLHLLRHYPLKDRRKMPLRKMVTIGGMKFRAIPVRHSVRAPAVGLRVTTKSRSFFYLPDVARLPNAKQALRGITVYIGDGATMARSMVRQKGRMVIGHASIAAQLDWCEKARVRRAIFTHCGSPIVQGDARVSNTLVRQLGCDRNIDARIACDGDRFAVV